MTFKYFEFAKRHFGIVLFLSIKFLFVLGLTDVTIGFKNKV